MTLFFFVPDAFVCFCVVLVLVLKLDGPEVCPGCDRKETNIKNTSQSYYSGSRELCQDSQPGASEGCCSPGNRAVGGEEFSL